MTDLISDDYSIYNTSCIDGLSKYKEESPKKKIQLTVTSPPYFNVKEYVEYKDYEEYLETLRTVFQLIFDITDDGRMCCVNISNILVQRENRSSESRRIPLAFHFVSLMEKIGWKFIEDIIWIKPEGAAKNRNGGFFQHRQPVAYKPNIVNEYVFVFQKPSTHLIDHIVRGYDAVTSENSKIMTEYERTNVWSINPETKVKHPAPYPEELSDKLIQYYSFSGDTVLDPFMGSGTTAVSALKFNRKCIGFEIHSEYIELCKKRLIDTVAKQTLIESITLNKDEYKGLTQEETIKRLSKFSKKHLLALSKTKTSNVKKTVLVDLVYNSYFVDST